MEVDSEETAALEEEEPQRTPTPPVATTLGGENRLSGLLEGVSIASSGKARKQGGSSKTFVQVRPDFCNSGVEYRYPIRGIDTQIQHWNLGIGIGTKGGVSVPKPPLGLEYRYWLPSTDTSCLKIRDIGNKKKEIRVVYRSWTFGFDSGIPRVTISGRSYDWTGSRGLHLLVSESGYALIETFQAPIAYTTIENVVLPKRLEQIGSLLLLTHILLLIV
ncbi:hypothetical protein GQ457_15G016110 [Hibiscus cannabinus]